MSGHEIVRDVGVKVHVDVDQHSFAGVHAALGKITASCQGIIGSSGFGGIQSELAHVAGIVGKIFTGPLGIPIALAGAGAGVAALGFHVAETAKELKKAAAMSGIDAMHFQELAFAGKESEVGMEAMQHGLMFLNRSLFQAGEGSESAKHALANIGIKNPAAIKDVSEAIGDIADKIKSMPQQQQIGAAMAAFGRGGAAMLPMLRKGSEGIRELIEEGKDLGVIMSADTMRMASALSESRKKVMATWEGISTRISAAIMPTLSSAMRGIAAWTKANRELISSGVDSFVSMLIQSFRVIGKLLEPVVHALGAILGVHTEHDPFEHWLKTLQSVMDTIEDIANYISGRPSALGASLAPDKAAYWDEAERQGINARFTGFAPVPVQRNAAGEPTQTGGILGGMFDWMREKSPLSEGLVDLNESIKELTAIFHNVSGVGSALAGERTSSKSPFLARMIDWISDDAEALIEHLHPINRETVDSRGLGSYLLPGRGHAPLSVNVNLSGVRGPIEQAMGTAVQNAFHEANRQALAAVAAG